jgi:tRNA pseudouridine(38-40) synthase
VLRTSLTGEALVRRLNTIAPELCFTAATRVLPEFRVRGASQRTYRYFDPGPVNDPERAFRAALLFQGRVDVRSFGRGLSQRTPQWRTVQSVVLRPVDGGREIEVRAPSFVWGMVRKIVGALREVDQGRLSLGQLRAAVDGNDRLTLPLAEPEGLVLWDVEYSGLAWEIQWAGPNRHQVASGLRSRATTWQRTSVLGTLRELELAGSRPVASRHANR